MTLPFKGLYIFTQDFGNDLKDTNGNSVYARYGLKGHDGLDFGCPTRTEIIAPHDGEVKEATFDGGGYGNYVKLEDDLGGSVIAHLDEIDVQVGYHLKEGDHIGWSDNTGNSTAPHCHWGYYLFPRNRDNGYDGFIDQQPMLEQLGIHLIVGQLPVIDQAKTEGNVVAGVYKGLDMSNEESMKSAVDAWYDVANGKYKTAEEFQTLQTQFDTVRKQLEDLQKQDANILPDIKNYQAMQVLGYNTTDDIASALNTRDNTILNLQKDQVALEKKNESLANIIKEDSQNNYTGMEKGLTATDKLRELEQYVTEIQKVTGADKPSLTSIIGKISYFRDLADKFLRKMEQEHKLKNLPKTAVTNIQQVHRNGVEWLLQSFKLIPKEKEVT